MTARHPSQSSAGDPRRCVRSHPALTRTSPAKGSALRVTVLRLTPSLVAAGTAPARPCRAAPGGRVRRPGGPDARHSFIAIPDRAVAPSFGRVLQHGAGIVLVPPRLCAEPRRRLFPRARHRGRVRHRAHRAAARTCEAALPAPSSLVWRALRALRATAFRAACARGWVAAGRPYASWACRSCRSAARGRSGCSRSRSRSRSASSSPAPRTSARTRRGADSIEQEQGRAMTGDTKRKIQRTQAVRSSCTKHRYSSRSSSTLLLSDSSCAASKSQVARSKATSMPRSKSAAGSTLARAVANLLTRRGTAATRSVLCCSE